jgi:phenylalanyl-tRNA synthetase alpha chain
MLNKWVEVGNSGMFRPEMLEPMGFPKDVHVHGWGISLERPTMIRYVTLKYQNIVLQRCAHTLWLLIV